MSASDGTAISSISYFPFGLTRTGSVNTTKEFTGQRLDSTGLYYYNARYYDPQIGRFISADATGQDLNNPQTLNRYKYCSNNPLKYTDPSGHDQVIATNSDGSYTIMDGNGKLLANATDIDDLAQKMKDCESKSRGVDLPLQKNAAAYLSTISGKPTWPNFNNNGAYVEASIFAITIASSDTVGVGEILTIGAYAVATWAWCYSNRESIVQAADPVDATGKKNKGGTSKEETYRNRNTGQEVKRHTLSDKNRNIIDQHYRLP
jgi:RHS repeat-associated protein